MKTNQANALYSAVANGKIIPGASRFVGTLPALKPTEMYIKLDQEDFDPENLPGNSFYPLNGGFVVDFGEGFLQNPDLNEEMFQNLGDARIVELVLPSATEIIRSYTFSAKTTKTNPLFLVIPSKVTEIGEQALGGNYYSTIVLYNKIAAEAGILAASFVKKIIFAETEGELYLKSGALSAVIAYDDEKTPVIINLPNAPAGGKMKVKIVAAGIPEVVANINVPAHYTTTNPNTDIDPQAFVDSYNVNYNGTDPNAPWGAQRLNGKEVN